MGTKGFRPDPRVNLRRDPVVLVDNKTHEQLAVGVLKNTTEPSILVMDVGLVQVCDLLREIVGELKTTNSHLAQLKQIETNLSKTFQIIAISADRPSKLKESMNRLIFLQRI